MSDWRTVAPGVLGLAQPGVNVYYLEAEATLVDTGLPFQARRLVAALRRLPLSLVVLTHHDLDHVGGLPALEAAFPDVPAAASPVDARFIRRTARRRGGRALLQGLVPPARVARELGDGEAIGAFRVVYTPGHSPGHLSLFRPSDGVLLAGDAAMVRGGRLLRNRLANEDDRLAKRSLLALAQLPVALVLPGHGPPLAVGPADFVAAGR